MSRHAVARLVAVTTSLSFAFASVTPRTAAAQVTSGRTGGSHTTIQVDRPDRTRYFRLTNGLVGATIPSGVAKGAGIDWKQFMNGAAYAMRFAPDGGPDCKPNAPDPRVEFWTLEAAPSDSRLAVNAAAQTGVLFVTGQMTHYVQASDFCQSKAFVALGQRGRGFAYVPFGAKGWSLRNFTAVPLAPLPPNARDKSSTVSVTTVARVMGVFSGPGIDAKVSGYASADMLGTSQAIAEGPGGDVAAQMLAQYGQTGKAADALKKMPGIVPGKDSEGWIELTLGTLSAQQIARSRGGPFTFVHVRAVHTAAELQPGAGYAELQALLASRGEVFYDPATTNDPRRR